MADITVTATCPECRGGGYSLTATSGASYWACLRCHGVGRVLLHPHAGLYQAPWPVASPRRALNKDTTP